MDKEVFTTVQLPVMGEIATIYDGKGLEFFSAMANAIRVYLQSI